MTTHTKTMADSAKGLKFTESPRWHDERLWFLDIHDKRIKTVDLAGHVTTVLELPFIPNGFGFTPEGAAVVGDALERRIHRWNGTALQQVADIGALTRVCLSDGIVDASGRMYIGDIGYDHLDPAAKPVEECVIALVGPDGETSVVANHLFFPNGMVITPDGRTLIVGETLGHRLTAFDILTDGSLRNRRVWARLPDGVWPDGICLDAEGAVWVATAAGHVARVREGGEITDRIDVNTKAYAVM
ncbi:MAG: SMP-30/gluconolactonase/LRE family protein, partial [Burkholderiales bacterium]